MIKRSLFLICTALLFVGACSSGSPSSSTTTTATTSPATTTAPPTSAPAEVDIQEVEFAFQPSQVNVTTSQAIVITNAGTALHNFSIEGTSISVDTKPGETTRLEAPGPSFAPGTYTIFCKYHRSQGMVGSLVASAG